MVQLVQQLSTDARCTWQQLSPDRKTPQEQMMMTAGSSRSTTAAG
jgi:hypothetical protein